MLLSVFSQLIGIGIQNQRVFDQWSYRTSQRIEAWTKLSRPEAVSGLPNKVTYGLDPICRSVMPEYDTNKATRNDGYECKEYAG